MSRHVTMKLHEPEEALQISIAGAVREVPVGNRLNPISDYFDATSRLKGKILAARNAQDAELLGLMIVGVISSAEFYFRSILGRMIQICPMCSRHAESSQVPVGAFSYYHGSDYCFVLGAMEHESLADAKRVSSNIERLTGFKTSDDSSTVAALSGYETLCELRHCLAHARGFIGLKGSRALQLEGRRLSKVLVAQDDALELLKLSHNAVRATNRFLFEALLDRWIDRDILAGSWAEDRVPFGLAWGAFHMAGEDVFNGNPRSAYAVVRGAVAKRRAAIAARA